MKRLSEEILDPHPQPPLKKIVDRFHDQAMSLFKKALNGEPDLLWTFYQNSPEALCQTLLKLDKKKSQPLLNLISLETNYPFFWMMVDSNENPEDSSGDSNAVPTTLSIDQLVELGANFEYIDSKGNNLLHFLAQEYSEQPLATLLQSGCIREDLQKLANGVNQNGQTPLHTAIEVMSQRSVAYSVCPAIVSNLIQLGAEIKKNRDGQTPLHYVYLCEPDEDDENEDGEGEHNGIRSRLIQLLREAGAQLDEQDLGGDTPFSLAIKNSTFIEDLISDHNVYKEDKQGLTPFFLIFKSFRGKDSKIQAEFERALCYFLKQCPTHTPEQSKNRKGDSVLLYCAQHGTPFGLEKLLETICSIQLRDKNFDGLHALSKALLSDQLENVKLVWEKGDWLTWLTEHPTLFHLPTGASIFSLSDQPQVQSFLQEKIGTQRWKEMFEKSDLYGISSKTWQRVFSSKPNIKQEDTDSEDLAFKMRQSFQTSSIPSQKNLSSLMKKSWKPLEQDSQLLELLFKTFETVFILNPEHEMHFSTLFEAELHKLYTQCQKTPLLRLFLEKNLTLIEKHPQALSSFLSPWIGTLQMIEPKVLGIYYQDEGSTWIATLDHLIHEWFHRYFHHCIQQNDLSLSKVEAIWSKMWPRIEINVFVQVETLSPECHQYHEALMRAIVSYQDSSYPSEEFLARVFESLKEFGQDSLAWYNAQLGEDLSFEAFLFNLLSAQKEVSKSSVQFSQTGEYSYFKSSSITLTLPTTTNNHSSCTV